jgi:CDP-glucose 4,6-dehydratase
MANGQRAVESVVGLNDSMWRGRHIFVTGHTGFKGGWLSLWLRKLGALVHGYALNPKDKPSLFDVARIASVLCSDTRADLADLAALERALMNATPEVVFHLAAQPLVRQSYRDPLGTFATNVMGTANLLEAVRKVDSVKAVVLITTDKVYDNREWQYPYREIDSLGGRDPYSASKAASELIATSYRASFFGTASPRPVPIATARAGNVIGGGDWAADRLVPDCLRAFVAGHPVSLRFPAAVRPWQHVLEPLAGYLALAEHLLGEGGPRFAQAWNFGPDPAGDASVGEVAEALARLWGGGAQVEHSPNAGAPHEAGLLRLDSSRARDSLGWTPRWPLAQALKQTVDWEQARQSGADMLKVSLDQIAAYVEDDG